MATKKELLKMLEEYDDDAVIVCMGEDGAWDNVKEVSCFGSVVAIEFGGSSPFSDE